MSKYKFRLQKLLDMRKEMEQKSIMEFQKARKESMLVKEKLDGLRESYEKYKNISEIKGVVEQKMARVYLNSLTYSIDDAENKLKLKMNIVSKRREELKKKQVDRKTVDILKEKDEASFIKEQNRLEQNANDEFALQGFLRAKREQSRI